MFLLGVIIYISINFLYNPCLALKHWGELSDWNPTIPKMNTSSTTKIDNKETNDIDQWSYRISRKTKWILWLDKPNDYDTWLWYVLDLIKIIINRFLWMLAVIALVYVLYCGFLVLSSWSGDTNASKGKSWIRTAIIALFWIGLSRLIVSAIIRFIKTMAK